MFRLKHKHRIWLVAVVALSLVASIFSSCARKTNTAEGAGDAGKKKEELAVSATDMDHALTRAATAALGDREGAVLVMDPHTGRLRAVVNPRLAFEQAFPPGSTIKSFTALTAMRAGLIDSESRTLCRGRFTSDSLDVVCSHPKSKTPFNLAQALAYSCNYFFATMSGRLSFDAFKATLASAGLGAKTGVNAGESAGTLRDGEWKVRDLLGEGDNLLVTPIQLLTAYSALMNGGHLYKPQVSTGENFSTFERGSLHIEDQQRAALIEGMRGAVVRGTAEKAELGSLPMFVFGKTGTSTASNGFRRQGWFVSFAAHAHSAAEASPDSLELAVLVFLKRAHGSEAAQVSHGVFQEYLRVRGGDGATGQGGEEATGRRGETLSVKILSENRVVKLSVEDYVVGVLSIEAAVEDEFEALKAQAIVSRTFALKNLGRHTGEGFDLCSNTHCQQYVGPSSRASENIRRAVESTAGEMLRDGAGQLIDAYFHAACGGMTANIQALWGAAPSSYLRGVRDDFCIAMPSQDWSDEIPADRLARALASDPLTDAGRTVDDVLVTRRDATGRAQVISIEGERRRQVSGWQFKIVIGRALGWNLLKSSRFTIGRRGSSFIFRGSGFGHGLGLCQRGAHVMARRGAACEQILDHYFPGTRLSGEQANAMVQIHKSVDEQGESPQPMSFAALRSCAFALTLGDSPLTSGATLSSEHFRVSYPAALERLKIETVLRTLEGARLDMLARVGSASVRVPDSTIDVVIHDTAQDFIAATGQSWWVAGVTRSRRIELQPLGVLIRRRVLTSTLRHEYAHAVIEEIGEGRVPRWLAEGLAVAFAGEGPSLERFRPKRRLLPDDLERRLANPRSAADMRALYAASYQGVRALIQREGEPSVWRRVAARGQKSEVKYDFRRLPRDPFAPEVQLLTTDL